eukprot:1566441-Ditylum_brightwellii.AAC.1
MAHGKKATIWPDDLKGADIINDKDPNGTWIECRCYNIKTKVQVLEGGHNGEAIRFTIITVKFWNKHLNSISPKDNMKLTNALIPFEEPSTLPAEASPVQDSLVEAALAEVPI